MTELCRDAGVFAIVPKDIGDIEAGLEHEAASRHVISPDLAHLGPSLVTVEPLADSSKAQSRNMDIIRLACALMDDETVDTVRKFDIGEEFEVSGVERVSRSTTAHGGKGLCRRYVSAEDMRDRSGLLVVSVVDAAVD